MANLSDHLVNYQSNDTLDSVTGRGATTTNDLTIGNLTSTGIDDNATSTTLTINADGSILVSDKVQVGSSTGNAYKIYANSNESNQIIGVFNQQAQDSGYITVSANGTTDFAQVRLGANADDMVLFAGGAERIRIDSSGHVKVGNTAASPDGTISIRSDSDAHAISIYEPAGANENWQIGVNANGDLQFYDSGSTVGSITFQDGGNVGIGTTDPNENLTIEVGSAEKGLLIKNSDFVAGTTGSTFDIGFGSSSGNSYTDLRALINGRNAWGDLVLQRGGGNVGIGNSSPVSALQVHDRQTTASNRTSPYTVLTISADYAGGDGQPYGTQSAGQGFGGGIVFKNESYDASYNDSAAIYSGVTDNSLDTHGGHLSFYTSTTRGGALSNRLHITHAGYVGIGDTSPDAKLKVQGSGDQLSSEVRVENTSTTQNGRGVVRVKSNTSTYGGAIFATNNDETAYGNNVFGLYTFDNQDLVIGTNNTRRMIILANGYAGLGGITDPQHFLDINCGAGAAPTYKGHIRLNSSSAVNSGHGGLEFMGSFFGTGYGVRLATVDEGSGMTPLTFNVRGNAAGWTEVMRITTTNSGRVGIKCTAPPTAFHVGSTMSIGTGNNQSITMRAYGSSDTDITSLIGGSSFGGLVLGTAYGHYVIGLQDNDDNDSFAVISGGGTTVGGAGTSFMDDQTFDYTCMRVLSKGIYNTPLGTSGRDVNINSVGILGYYSSVREHKGNINSMTDISWLYNLNPVTFNYKQQNSNFEFIEELETETSYGLIADEVANVNSDFVFYNTNDELAGVDYKMFTAVLIKALQDHKLTIESLETRIAALEAN